MADNLQQRTLLALVWSFVEALAQRGVQFAVGIVLARLLFPEQFGLIGMLTIFMAVIQSFLDSGFGAALIQKQDVTQTDICSIFYFNIAVGFAAAGLLCLAAPWIAAFYNQPVLTPLMRALSLTIVINSFGMIQGTLLVKQINFKTTTKVSLIAGALSGMIGIALAARGSASGAWSIQQISASLFYDGSSLVLQPLEAGPDLQLHCAAGNVRVRVPAAVLERSEPDLRQHLSAGDRQAVLGGRSGVFYPRENPERSSFANAVRDGGARHLPGLLDDPG